MSEPAELGGGQFEVIVRVKNPDGSKEEWTVGRMVVDPQRHHDHVATVQVDFDYGEEDNLGFPPLTKLMRAPTQTMELHIRGRLERADPNSDELYRVVRTPAPVICPECVQGKHRNCDGRAWDVEKDAMSACECKDESHG